MTLKIRNFKQEHRQGSAQGGAQVPGRKLQQSHPERLHVLPDRLFQPLKGQLNLHNTIYLFKYVL